MYIVADIEKIKKTIKKVLKKHEIRADITSCNNYKAIMISNNEEDDDYIYMWIRLMNIPDTACYVVDIANISLPKNKRRTGVFTDLYDELNKCKYVGKIRIISVCTAEMRNWCLKYKLTPYNDGNDYTN